MKRISYFGCIVCVALSMTSGALAQDAYLEELLASVENENASLLQASPEAILVSCDGSKQYTFNKDVPAEGYGTSEENARAMLFELVQYKAVAIAKLNQQCEKQDVHLQYCRAEDTCEVLEPEPLGKGNINCGVISYQYRTTGWTIPDYLKTLVAKLFGWIPGTGAETLYPYKASATCRVKGDMLLKCGGCL